LRGSASLVIASFTWSRVVARAVKQALAMVVSLRK
jgi:hypothetical protein